MSESRLSLVRILKEAKTPRNPVGAGFLVSSKKDVGNTYYVITCAHVIAYVLKIPEDTIEPPTQPIFLDFPLLKTPHEPLSAIVHKWYPVKKMASMNELGDIAVLKLTVNTLPDKDQNNQHLIAQSLDDFLGRTVLMCGFPKGMEHGDWLKGQLQGLIGNGRVQIETEVGRRNVAPGFSGTPVWDEEEKTVLGMMVSTTKREEDKAAYMIPAKQLYQAWPELDEHIHHINPYRGLQAFSENDADYFFGRKEIVDELQQAVKENPFVAITGISGSGKSSLVFAGLIPFLRKEGNWLIAHFRPENQPVDKLAQALGNLFYHGSDKEELAAKNKRLANNLNEGKTNLSFLIPSLLTDHPNQRLLLIIDQFEELYNPNLNENQQHCFIDGLLQLVQSQNNTPKCTLLITLRADFFGQVLRHKKFADVLRSNHQEILGSMSETDFRSVIEEPAKKLGIIPESGLTDLILSDLKRGTGNLLLLEFALEKLWETRTYSHLTLQAYRKIGGIEGALKNQAERIYEYFEKKGKKETFRRALVQLVHPVKNDVYARKLATREQVGEESWSLITELANEKNRLVVTGYDEIAKKETVELVHDALIENWDQLKEWVKESQEFRIWQDDLHQSISYWESQKKKAGALLQGTKLAKAEEMLKKFGDELNETEKSYIKKSIARRKKQRIVFISLITSVFLLILSALGIQIQEQKKTLRNQSLAVAEIAQQETNSGNAVNGILYSLEVLPKGKSISYLDRPYVPEAEEQLYNALVHQRERRTLIGHQDYIYDLDISPNGQYIVTASKDKTARLWEVNSGKLLKIFDEHTDEVFCATFSPDSQWIITASMDKEAHLWNVNDRKLTHKFKHNGDVNCADFSPDSQLVVTISDNTAHLWEVKTGQFLHVLKGHNGIIRKAVFSPNGQLLVTTSYDHSAIVWETKSGKLLHKLTGHGGTVWNAAFHPDGQRLVTVSDDQTARVWDVYSGKLLYTLNGHKGRVSHAAFSPDGQYIATASRDESARIWKADNGQLIHELKGHNYYVSRAVFSPDSQQLATTSWDGTVRLWEVNSGELVYVLRGHQKQTRINDVAFDPTGQYLATASHDKTARLWEITQSNPLVKVLEGHEDGVKDATFSPNGQYVATASWDKSARLWDVGSGQLLHTLEGHQQKVNHVVFSSDSQYIATASEDKTARVWRVDSGKLLRVLSGHTDTVNQVAFSPNGQYLATASTDNTARLWEINTGKVLYTFRHESLVNFVTFSPQGQYLVTTSGNWGDADSTARLWNTHTGQLLYVFEDKNGVVYADFSPQGKYLITISGDLSDIVRLWEVSSGRLLHILDGHNNHVNYADFSPDGSLVVTASDDRTACLWEVDSGKLLHTLIGHDSIVSSVHFSPDGQRLLTSSFDGTARLWHVKTGKSFYVFKGHKDTIFNAEFSPDGRYVVTASQDGTARLWTIFSSTQALIDYAHENVPRQLTSEQHERYFGAEQSKLFSFLE